MPLWRGWFKVKNTKKPGKPGKKKIIWLVVALSLFLTAGLVRAGSLTPSGSPASTMHTLQEIYDSLAGTFDSTNSTATSTGSLVQILKYITNNLTFTSSGGNAVFNSGNTFLSTTTLTGTLNVAVGGLQIATTTRIDNLGQATLTTSSISVLTVNTSSSLAAITFTSATGTNAVFTGVASSTGFQSGGLQFNNATGTNLFISGVASSSVFQTPALSFNNATGTNAFFSGVASSTAFQTGALQFNNATGTNLKAGLALFTTASSTNFQAGNIQFQDATGTNIRITQLVSTGSSTVVGLNFSNATGTNLNGTQLVFTGSSTISSLNFTMATGTSMVLTASGTVLGFDLTGFPLAVATDSLVELGPFNIVGGHASGTLIGANYPSTTFFGDFINLQLASNTIFRVTNAGNASSTNFQAGGLQFGNATGTNAFFSGVASSTNFQTGGLQFNNATGTNILLSGTLTVNTLTSNAALTIGNLAQNLTLQGSTAIITATSSNSIIFNTGGAEQMRIASSGFIGIGTTTPNHALVIGNGTAQDDVLIPKGFICVDSNNSGCPAAGSAANIGTVFASNTAITAIDLAENYPVNDISIEAGDIVALDTVNEGFIERATPDNQNQVVGIISTAPGVLLGRKVENSRALALSGRVPVKISDEGGPIKVGDPIILSSSTPGVGMKGTNGRIVGYALQNWAGGTGKINVFVKLQPAPAEPNFLDQIKTSLNKLGLAIENGILKVTTLIADLIQSKRVETDTLSANQLEMKDADTGAIYCLQIKSGEWVKTPGACGATNSTTAQTVTSPTPPPPTTTAPTTTTSTATTTTSTDTTTTATTTVQATTTTDTSVAPATTTTPDTTTPSATTTSMDTSTPPTTTGSTTTSNATN